MTTQVTSGDVAEDFFTSSPGNSASFENIGDKCGGIILDYSVVQQRDFDTDELDWWDEAKTQPKMQLVVSLQTEERDPMDPEDTGIRKLYIKGSKKSGSQSPHDAVATACKRAGVKSISKGGYLELTFVGEEAPKKKGMNPRKLYEGTYDPTATAAADTAAFLGTQPAAQAVPAVQAQPVQQAAPAAAAPAPAPAAAPAAADPVGTARALIAAAQPDAIIQAATGLDPAVIAVLRNGA